MDKFGSEVKIQLPTKLKKELENEAKEHNMPIDKIIRIHLSRWGNILRWY